LPSRPASSRRSRSGRSPRLANPHSAMSDRGMRRLFDRLVALGGVRELTGRSTFRLAADDGGESLPRHRLGRCEDHGLDPHHEFPPAQGSGQIGQLAIEAGFWSGAPSHGLVHRFQSSNHIRRLDRVCKTTCGRPGPG
jgi:hypothetical protein